MDLALLLERRDRIEEAETELRRAIALDPGLARPRMELARFFETRGEVAQAAELYAQAAERDPIGAEAYFREELHEAPNDASALVNLANVLSRQHNFEEAERLYRRALRQDADDDITLINLGLLLHRAGRQEEALRALQRAAQLRPQDARVQLIPAAMPSPGWIASRRPRRCTARRCNWSRTSMMR